MKLRITGTLGDCMAAVAALQAPTSGLTVREASDFYPNRGALVLGRVYLDVALAVEPRAVGWPDPAGGAR